MQKRDQKSDALGGAINQLENLIKQKTGDSDTGKQEQLPILDEFVDEDTLEATDKQETDTSDLTQADLELAMARLTEQLEMELETLAGMLKESMLHEFRKEMASVLGVDTEHAKRDEAADKFKSDGNKNSS